MAQSNLISTRIALQGAIEIINQLRGMGTAGEAALRQIQQAIAGTAGPIATLGRSTGALRQSFGEVNGAIGALSENIGPALNRLNRFTRVFGELRGAIGVLAPAFQTFAGAGVLGAVVLAAQQGARAIDDLKDSAEALGVSLDQLQSLQAAAATQGVDIEKFTRAFELFTTKVGEATKSREDFAEKANLKAQEEALAQEKAAAAIVSAKEAVARAAREQEGLAAGYAKARLEQERLSNAQDQYTLSTKKLHDEQNAQGTRGIALGQNLQQRIKESETDIKLAQQTINTSEAMRTARNREAEAANNLRAAQMRLREAYQEQAIGIERSRLESEKQRDSFQKLGVDITKGTNEAFIQFIQKMEQMDDVAKRNSYLREQFGRSWVTMAEIVGLGSASLRKFQGEWKDTFVAITEGDADLAKSFQASWGTMIFNVKNFASIFGNLLGPMLTPIFDGISRLLKRTEGDMRDFTTAFVRVVEGPIKFLGEGLNNLIGTMGAAFRVIRAVFGTIADVLNQVFGWNVKDSELMVGLVVWYGLLALIVPRVLAVGASLLRLGAGFARVATLVIGLRVAMLPTLALLSGPGGFIVVIGLALAAIAAMDPQARPAMNAFFNFMNEGFNNLIGTIGAFIRMVGAAIEALGRLAGASAGSMGAKTPQYSRDAAPTPSDFARRVEQENPQLFRARGGPIPGFGRGDHVPVVAEPGEYMVRRSSVERVGLGFMHMLNAGLVQPLRMAADGLVDSMGSIGPQPIYVRAGASPMAPQEQSAMFHLTIGERTYKNLSAPASTARDMYRHAREQSRTQMAPAQGWKK